MRHIRKFMALGAVVMAATGCSTTTKSPSPEDLERIQLWQSAEYAPDHSQPVIRVAIVQPPSGEKPAFIDAWNQINSAHADIGQLVQAGGKLVYVGVKTVRDLPPCPVTYTIPIGPFYCRRNRHIVFEMPINDAPVNIPGRPPRHHIEMGDIPGNFVSGYDDGCRIAQVLPALWPTGALSGQQ